MRKLLASLLFIPSVILAQTPIRVTVTDSVAYKFIAKPRVDTVIKVDTLIRCLDSSLHPITCPSTPPVDTTTPPNPCTTGSCEHEPVGMTVLTERTYAARNENGWTDVNSGGGSMSIVTSPSGPTSPGTTGAIKYAQGCCAGGAPTDNTKSWTARPRTIYVALTFMLSSNFYGHSASEVNKLLYIYSPTSNNDHFYLAAMGAGMNGLQPQVRWEGGAGNVNYTPNLKPSVTISRGVWHVFEVLATGNATSVSNGSLELWLDGEKIASYSAIKFNSGATTWSRLLQGSNYGGNNSTPPADQFLYLDHLRISGK